MIKVTLKLDEITHAVLSEAAEKDDRTLPGYILRRLKEITVSPESKIPSPESKIPSPEPKIPSPEAAKNSEHVVLDLETPIAPYVAPSAPKPAVPAPASDLGNQFRSMSAKDFWAVERSSLSEADKLLYDIAAKDYTG